MPRLVWLTDPHLNFVTPTTFDALMQSITREQPDHVLLGGDIHEATHLLMALNGIAEVLRCPIHFVLGNHDYYRGSIGAIRDGVTQLAAASPYLNYLSAGGVVELTPEVGLVGHGGWGDGRIGDYARSYVILNDWLLISDFIGLNQAQRLDKLHALGDEAGAHLRRVLPEALARYAHVYVLTHVPPFKAACWHEGAISDDHFLPHFTCQAAGDALLAAADAHPNRQITVLCGHTHGSGTAQPRPNLHVITGGTEYGAPAVQKVWDV